LRCIKSESDIPLSYYEGIDDIHFSLFVDHLMPQKLVKVLVLSWGQYNDPKIVWEQLLSIVTGKMELPTLTKIRSLPDKLDKTHFVYSTTDEVIEFYQQIKWFRRAIDQSQETECSKLRKTYSTIFIPNNIMTVPAEEKGVVNKNYDIVFYRNEFKRVVLWHLGHLQNVCFYTK